MDSAFPSHRNFYGIYGATSYRKVIARDASGAMRPMERLRCTGCEREFLDVQARLQDVRCAPASRKALMSGCAFGGMAWLRLNDGFQFQIKAKRAYLLSIS